MPDWKSFVREHLKLSDITAQRELEIIEDLAQQLEDVYQEAIRNGADAAGAQTAAEQHVSDWRSFAQELSQLQKRHHIPLTQRIEPSHEEAGWKLFLSELLRDLLVGARMLRKTPRFTFLAAVTIALGIGATTAIFSVVNGVILQPLAYDHPERILWVWGKFSQGDRAAISPPDFQDFRANAKSFETFAAMHIMHQFVPSPMTLSGAEKSTKLDAALVTSGFFEVFGARAFLGRTFARSDERENAGVVVLSHSAWENYFGSDPRIIGRSVTINQTPHAVIGVLEKGFRYPLDVDLWVPLNFSNPEMKQRKFHFLRPIVRLREGVSMENANAELGTIAAQLEKQYPESNRTWGVRLETLQQQMVGDLRKPLFVIFAAVCLLLLIACVNVANLLLARITSRNKEMAIRVAVGAGRKRLFRQLLAESLLLSIPSGFLGLLIAYWAVEAFRKAGPDYIPRLPEVGVDPWTLLFMLVCSLVAAILVSIAPALDLLPRVTSERLKEGKYSGMRTGSGRLRQILAISEIALSLILLAGAGLLLKSFWKLTHVDLGFNANNLTVVRVSLDENKYATADSVIAFVEEAMQRIGSLPGVESVGAGTGVPLIPAGGDRFFTIVGRPIPPNDAEKPNAQFRAVTQNYFRTLSIPLILGRTFSNGDHQTSMKVVVVNEAFVKKFYNNEDVLGKQIDIDFGVPIRAQIIGIVRSTRQNLADPPEPEMYVLHKQSPMGFFVLAVRSSIGGAIQQSVQSRLQEMDKDISLNKFRTMEDVKSQAAIRNRLNATLLAVAASIALLLAAIGIYGVLSFSVEQRQQEIGLRLALGAQRRDILAMILRHGIGLAGLGLLLGITGALMLTRVMTSFLFEVSPGDPLILAGVSLLLGAVAVLACLVPAHRATRVDPLSTLRYE